MYLLGQLEHGVYAPPESPNPDDTEPELEVGVGDIAEDEEDELVERVQRQLKHKPVSVPRIQNPFEGNPMAESIFWRVLSQAADEAILPSGYGFLRGEIGYGDWHSIEHIVVGKKRRGRQYKVTLPRVVWQPRIQAWVQALEGLSHTLAIHEWVV